MTRVPAAFQRMVFQVSLTAFVATSAMATPKKTYRPLPEPMKALAKGYGSCIATDKITIQGLPVRYMYREAPDDRVDSGWRFFAGVESDAYTNDPSNSGIFDVNTIANYDSSIVPHLDAPPGSSFEKPDLDQGFVVVTTGNPLPDQFPVVHGRYQMTRDWAVTLPGQFKRRIEDDSLVLWRPGLTLWTIAWGNDHKESIDQRLDLIRRDASKNAFNLETERDGRVVRFSYRLTEHRRNEDVHALYAFAFSETGHVQMAIYFDSENDFETARRIWRSIEASVTK